LTEYLLAIATSEALLRADPHKLETRSDLARMYSAIGMWHRKSGNRREAARFLQQGSNFFDEAVAGDPVNAEIRRGREEVRRELQKMRDQGGASL
jgi:hypothetical protein